MKSLKFIILTAFTLANSYLCADEEFLRIPDLNAACCPKQGPPGPQGATGPAGPTGPQGEPGVTDYGYFYTQTAQTVTALNTITLDIADSEQSGGFSLTGGGVEVPTAGAYLLNYRILSSTTTASVGITVNGGSVVSNSVFSNNNVGNIIINGQIILRLDASDVVRLVNARTSTSITLPIPAAANAAVPIIAELTMLRLAD